MSLKTWLIDVGNSNIAYCSVQEEGMGSVRRFPTNDVTTLLSTLPFNSQDRLVISSVVPDVDRHFDQFEHVTYLSHATMQKIEMNVPFPEQVGADRLANVLGAYVKFKKACLVIDSGTAITFCYVDKQGVYQGGAIFPGMGISSKALQLYTAKIPLIHVQKRDAIFGKTTTEAVHSGLYKGYLHLISGMIKEYKEKYPEITVVGTGIGLDIYLSELEMDCYVPDLIFEGLLAFSQETV